MLRLLASSSIRPSVPLRRFSRSCRGCKIPSRYQSIPNSWGLSFRSFGAVPESHRGTDRRTNTGASWGALNNSRPALSQKRKAPCLTSYRPFSIRSESLCLDLRDVHPKLRFRKGAPFADMSLGSPKNGKRCVPARRNDVTLRRRSNLT